MSYIVKIENGQTRQPQFKLGAPLNLSIKSGEQLAIVGPNGGGKSIITGIITGSHPLRGAGVEYDFGAGASSSVYDNIKYIAFRDSYGASTDSGYYLQQRWHSYVDDEAPLVGDMLPASEDEALRKELFALFGIEKMLHRRVVMLSSGELRKFQITKALLTTPKLLIMDNPFIGLDAPTRGELSRLFGELVALGRCQVILSLSKSDDLPPFITHVVEVRERCCSEKMSAEEYNASRARFSSPLLSERQHELIATAPTIVEPSDKEEVVALRKVGIKYGDRQILKALDWQILRGERWALSGENGAGKSTLLSLVCADNPQSYACDISLFGARRGSGESIWDIKRRIGYVSPEMHRAYMMDLPALDIVGSGLHDSIGLHRRLSEEQREVALRWMEIFEISELATRSFMQLSSGEQRLVLLARAFVKSPELLILDEPLHGLDLRFRRLTLEIIESYCRRADRTLIIVTHYKEELPGCITHSLHLLRN
ncbi:MAG: ATP-binding cassette domain-containing protein [Rikenellaceae bacterium]